MKIFSEIKENNSKRIDYYSNYNMIIYLDNGFKIKYNGIGVYKTLNDCNLIML